MADIRNHVLHIWVDLEGDPAYLHYASNETISGVQFREPPESNLPLVSDMSSDILSRPVDVDKFGVIYAGAQKNIGQAGLALVVVRKDLLSCIIAHGTTNIALGLFAKTTGQWGLW